MTEELDESLVQEAIAYYRWNERMQADFAARVGAAEVSVQSPDELVEVRVRVDGSVRMVNLVGSLQGRTDVEVSRSINAALGAAADAADWARRTLYAETVGRYPVSRAG
ncbi:MAG: YbaB/EbfC family DNA-binding protein [Micromonosporaceae bacterium]|nr:YbaB/EbfC family DNA-binding protein [Micromonosporaceae bacterium]